MKPQRVIAIVTASFAASFGIASCGGFSTEEAQARCDQEEEARQGGGCFTLSTYDTCVAAFEECGDEVDVNDGCPLEYTCPE